MLTYQDILDGVRYLKSGDYMDTVPAHVSWREYEFRNDNFSRQVRDWLNSIIIQYASLEDSSAPATADDLHMLRVVGGDFSTQEDHGSKLITLLCTTLSELQEGENLLEKLTPRIEHYFQATYPRVSSSQEIAAAAEVAQLNQALTDLKSGEEFKRRDEQLKKIEAELSDKAEQQKKQAAELLAREQALQQRVAALESKEKQLTEQATALDVRTETVQQSEVEFQARKQQQIQQDAVLEKREAGYQLLVETIQKQKQAILGYQEKLQELYNIISEKLGDEVESQVSYKALRELLSFYDKEMQNTIKYAKASEEANKALIHTVLYSSKKEQSKAQTVRDYFRSAGTLPNNYDDPKQAQAEWNAYLKKHSDDKINRQLAINKVSNQITEARLSKNRLEQCQEQLAAAAKSTLESLEGKNNTLLSIKEYIEKLPEPDNIESEIDVIMSRSQQSRRRSLAIEPTTAASRSASDSSIFSDSERSDDSIGSNDSADALDVPEAPSMAPPPPPPGPPPPSFFTTAAQPLQIKKGAGNSSKDAIKPPSMDDVLKVMGSVKLRSAAVREIAAPASTSSEPSFAEQLKNKTQQQLDIRASKPSADEIKSLAGKRIIYQDESKEWLMLSDKASAATNLSKLTELQRSVATLNSKDVSALTDSDRDAISAELTSYLRTQAFQSNQLNLRGSARLHTFAAVKKHGEEIKAAPKQNLDLFDVLATRLPPESYSKFTYVLSKRDNAWKLELLVPQNLLPKEKLKEPKGYIFSLDINEIPDLENTLKGLPNRELHAITSADLWDTKNIIKKYHKELIASNKLGLELTPKENNKTLSKGLDLLGILANATQMKGLTKANQSDDEEESKQSTPRMGGGDSWDE